MKRKSITPSFILFSLTTLLFPGLLYARVTGCTVDTAGANKGEVVACAANITIKDIIVKITDWVLGFGAAVAILFIIYAGIQYMTAAGKENQVDSAKQTLTNAIIGLIVILLSYVIVSLVTKSTFSILKN